MKDIKKVENIVLVSLAEKFCKGVTVLLAEKLDMYNIDTKDMVVYDLINPKEVLEKCGLEYLKKRERGVVSSICGFQNSVISINFDLFMDNYDLFENSYICYLHLPLELTEGKINLIDYEFRDKFLIEHTDLKVSLKNRLKKNAVSKIIAEMKGV